MLRRVRAHVRLSFFILSLWWAPQNRWNSGFSSRVFSLKGNITTYKWLTQFHLDAEWRKNGRKTFFFLRYIIKHFWEWCNKKINAFVHQIRMLNNPKQSDQPFNFLSWQKWMFALAFNPSIYSIINGNNKRVHKCELMLLQSTEKRRGKIKHSELNPRHHISIIAHFVYL